MRELTLYHKSTCPFCIKVLHYMDKNDIMMPMKNVSDIDNYKELLKIGGKAQVPCLVIDGKALYESDDIIQWLERNKSTNEVTKEQWIETVHHSDTCDIGSLPAAGGEVKNV